MVPLCFSSEKLHPSPDMSLAGSVLIVLIFLYLDPPAILASNYGKVSSNFDKQLKKAATSIQSTNNIEKCKRNIDVLRCCVSLINNYVLRNKFVDAYETLKDNCVTSMCTTAVELNTIFIDSSLRHACGEAETYVYHGSDVVHIYNMRRLENERKTDGTMRLQLLTGLIVLDVRLTLDNRRLDNLFKKIPNYDFWVKQLSRDVPGFVITSNDIADLLACPRILNLYNDYKTYLGQHCNLAKVKWVVNVYCVNRRDAKLNKKNFKTIMTAVCESNGTIDKPVVFKNAVTTFISAFLSNQVVNEALMANLLYNRGYNFRDFENLEYNELKISKYETKWSFSRAVELYRFTCNHRQNIDFVKCLFDWTNVAYNLRAIEVSPDFVINDFKYNMQPNIEKFVQALANIAIIANRLGENTMYCIVEKKHKKELFLIYYFSQWRFSGDPNLTVQNFYKYFVELRIQIYDSDSCKLFLGALSKPLYDFSKKCYNDKRNSIDCAKEAQKMWLKVTEK